MDKFLQLGDLEKRKFSRAGRGNKNAPTSAQFDDDSAESLLANWQDTSPPPPKAARKGASSQMR